MLEQPLDDRDTELERSLRRLRPAEPAGDVRSIFLSLKLRSQQRWLRTWQAVAMGLGLTLIGMLALGHPITAPSDRIVYVPVQERVVTYQGPRQPAPTPETGRPRASQILPDFPECYLVLRDAVLRNGLAALPAPTGGGAAPKGPVTVRQWQEELGLAAPARPADRSFDPLELLFWRGT